MNNETRHHQITQFVGREVFHCVSHLVLELTSKAEHFPDYEEDLLSAWHAPLTEDDYAEAYASLSVSGRKDYLPDGCQTWQEVCELHNIHPSTTYDYRREVFEHWIISDWLADRLEAHGELVMRDFFGLTVWGRTWSGQAISMDGVIGAIFDELHQGAA